MNFKVNLMIFFVVGVAIGHPLAEQKHHDYNKVIPVLSRDVKLNEQVSRQQVTSHVIAVPLLHDSDVDSYVITKNAEGNVELIDEDYRDIDLTEIVRKHSKKFWIDVIKKVAKILHKTAKAYCHFKPSFEPCKILGWH